MVEDDRLKEWMNRPIAGTAGRVVECVAADQCRDRLARSAQAPRIEAWCPGGQDHCEQGRLGVRRQFRQMPFGQVQPEDMVCT
ncbi:hypothetical protein [Siccirubricoccus deserti]|uniref:Uncharacterized protein n=1 Tax=Siccirubricoccus deserti TaxID=2013562 RepID=A0A9X0R120_9PROT|nr:hypothetical protein [Siccirubricoccus deserti]MBC4017509.1 hypothetical protein [Siccirubricoccus deserti]